MGLTEEVMQGVREQGYIIREVQGFYEDYNSVHYIIARKGAIMYVADFHYCSCYGLYDETVDSVIRGFTLLTDEKIAKFKESVWLDKEDHLKYLNSL